MRRTATITAAAAIAAAALSTPVVAQGLGFGVETGPRYDSRYHGTPSYDPSPNQLGPYYYGPKSYHRPRYSYRPHGSVGPNTQGDCYTQSLHGRVCID